MSIGLRKISALTLAHESLVVYLKLIHYKNNYTNFKTKILYTTL